MAKNNSTAATLESKKAEIVAQLSGFKQRGGGGSVYKSLFEIPVSSDVVSDILANVDQFGQAKIGDFTIQCSGLSAAQATKPCSIMIEQAKDGARYEITAGRPTYTSLGQIRLKLVPMSAEPVTLAEVEQDELDAAIAANEFYFEATEDTSVYVKLVDGKPTIVKKA